MKEIILKIDGMMCEGCENRVKNAIGNIDGVDKVSADHSTGKVIVILNKEIDSKIIKDTIEDIGYEVIGE